LSQPNLPDRVLLEELAKRAEQKRATRAVQEALLGELFPEQRAFVTDPHRRKAVLGSRRAGKTEMWSRYAVMVALEHPRTLTRLWSHARLRAKDLLWNPLKYLLQRNGISFEANETELSITLKNGSVIRLVGANQDKEAQKKRGEKTKLEVVLETQNFPGFLQSLVDDVIEPSLMDEMGTVCMEGTPGPICTGYWYEVTGAQSPTGTWDSDTYKAGKWRVHRWTMLQNPYLPHARAYLEELKSSKRWADDNPTYLREYCGRWVNDLGSLFYSFDATRNTYDPNKIQPYGPGWSHALGWDLGFRDDMAIAIIGWNPDFDGDVYEVFSWKKPEVKDAGTVMRVIDDVEKRLKLNLVEVVADTGGGGRMYVEEVMTRFGRAFKPAKKTEKYEHVRLMNDHLITGKLKLVPGSPWAEEMSALQRDPDWPDPDKPEAPPKEDPRCANHIDDAGLYCFRAAYAHFANIVKTKVKKDTDDWALDIERQLVERYRRRDKYDWTHRLEEGLEYADGS
jgi:hypothetical protein